MVVLLRSIAFNYGRDGCSPCMWSLRERRFWIEGLRIEPANAAAVRLTMGRIVSAIARYTACLRCSIVVQLRTAGRARAEAAEPISGT